MTATWADSSVSIIVGMAVGLALAFLPVGGGRIGRRVAVATVSLLAGKVIVLASDSHDWLRAGLILLEAAVLLLFELYKPGALSGLLWIAVAVVGVWKWSELGPWVASARPWVAWGSTAAVVLLAFLAYGRRRLEVDRSTMKGMW